VIYNERGPFIKSLRNIPGVELINVNHLNLLLLAPGGHLGRFCVWTRDAFERLDTLYGSYKRASAKAGFSLPRALISNADLGRIINSDEVQAVLRPKITQTKLRRRKNPLTNLGFRIKLNPYAKTALRLQLLDQERRAKGVKPTVAPLAKRKALKKRLKKDYSKFRAILLSKK